MSYDRAEITSWKPCSTLPREWTVANTARSLGDEDLAMYIVTSKPKVANTARSLGDEDLRLYPVAGLE